MDFHTFCEQHMEILEGLDHEEVSRQAVISEWERRQNEAKVKELQKNAMTSVTRLNKKIKDLRIKINDLKSQIQTVTDVINDDYDGGWDEFFTNVDDDGMEKLRKVKWLPVIEYDEESAHVMEVCAKSGAC